MRLTSRKWRMVYPLALLAVLASPARLSAQLCIGFLRSSADPAPPCEPRPAADAPRIAGHLATLGVNAALGGLSVGVSERMRGRGFWKGFASGAAGGSVIYVGKRIAADDFTGAGLLGRQVAAVGASMVANGSEGRGLLKRVVLPVGFVRVQVDRGASRPLGARIDLAGVAALGYAVARPDTELDWNSTLSSGSPVFVASGEHPWRAWHLAGVVILKDRRLPAEMRRAAMNTALGHERVHVVQHDFTAIVWGEPVQRQILGRIPGGAALHRYVDLRPDLAVWSGLTLLLPYDLRPWEWESHFLMGQ